MRRFVQAYDLDLPFIVGNAWPNFYLDRSFICACSSTCSVICAPGTHTPTFLGSLKNAQTFSTGSYRNVFSIFIAMP